MKWLRRQPAPGARAGRAVRCCPSAWRRLRSRRADSASAEQFVERGALLLLRLLLNGPSKIFVELAGNCIEPAPIIGDRLENDGVPMTTNPDFLPGKAKLLRETHGLRPTRPKQLCRL